MGFSTFPWVTTHLSSLWGPLLGFLLLMDFEAWAFNRLTRFILQQVDSLASKPIQVHYHCLDLADQGLEEPLESESPIRAT